MMTIEQALFGYSNGHHLLASSKKLSNTSLKMLTPLTDSSGSGNHREHDGYLTGCYLIDDDCFALSKTWYADEMPRPGCVWTHTLFLVTQSLKMMTYTDLDNLFIRPIINTSDWKLPYESTIQTDAQPLGEKLNDYKYINASANNLLNLISKSSNPVVIFSNKNTMYNILLESLLCTWNVDFFKKLSFCTCSFSNRLMNKTEIALQIAPANMSKSYFRSNNAIDFYDDTDIEAEINSHTSCKFDELNEFIRSFDLQFYSYTNFAAFSTLLLFLNYDNNFTLKGYEDLLLSNFSTEDATKISDGFFTLAFSKHTPFSNNINRNTLLNIMQELCTSKNSQNIFSLVSCTTFKQIMQQIWANDNSIIFSLLSDFIERELNEYGEQLISIASMLMTPCDVDKIINHNSICIVLVQTNWKLALNGNIWQKPASFQADILRSLSTAYKNCSDDDKIHMTSVFQNIFSLSKESIEECLYNEFGKLSIEMFFDWAEAMQDSNLIKRWAKLCSFEQAVSVNKLAMSNNALLFSVVIQFINPYSPDIQNVSSEVWMKLYNRFCHKSNDKTIRELYAKFLLPIILRTNQEFPDELVKFSFKTVHIILQNDAMDYSSWENLSSLLPEVAWYNSWDKCKRLRKAARKKDYDIF